MNLMEYRKIIRGNIYKIRYKNKRKDKFGKMKYKRYDTYECYWINNKKGVKGKMKYNNGNINEDYWIDKKRENRNMKFNNVILMKVIRLMIKKEQKE